MDHASSVATRDDIGGRSHTARLGYAFAALAAAMAVVLLVQDRAAEAQIGFGQFLCPILASLANTLAGFLAFLRPILNALLAAFNCGISV